MKSCLSYKFLLPLFLVIVAASCKKLDLAPTNRYTELTFWQSDANVNNALNNCYNGIYDSGLVFYDEGLSDNAVAKAGSANGVSTIASGNFTPTLDRFRSDWAYYYAGIKSCNIFLDNVDNNTTLDAAVKERMKAEVRFIRAWHHFNLMKWYGDVPLLDHDVTPDEAKTIARSPKADVEAFISSELDAVAAVLPSNTQYAAADNGRITKGAALALKARMYLYDGDKMQDVVSLCEQIMNGDNGTYALAPDYTSLFSDMTVNKNSSENIFDLEYVPTLRAWGDYFDFAPISAGARTGGLSPTQELVNSYIMLNGKPIADAASGYDENNPYTNRDPRLTATVVYDQYVWTNPDGSTQIIYIKPGSTPAGASSANEYSNSGQGSATGYYWRKYWDPEYTAPGISSGLNIHLIRYAEVLLMYAEAKNALGQMTEDVWNQTIRALRSRAGFTDVGALDYPGSTVDMTELVRNERRCEFAMEGIRIDDIRRWKIAESVLNTWAHGAKFGDPTVDNGYIRAQLRVFDASKNYLWPVPPTEISLNSNLTQNPNY
ncbi:MAG: RagB/SusD family nutrient uptake outer membrane protein [Williamsia sp.]|nr:RagB/SusD family nutrient uptake outer membrane protein [Williamsia sp.]